METWVRCFLFNDDDEILLIKHDPNQPWVLPWWHLEWNETVYACLEREIQEELWVDIVILWVQNDISTHTVSPLPVPISVYKVAYEHRERGSIEKLEYVFLATTPERVENVDKEEVYDFKWVSQEEFFELEADEEMFEYFQEILDQNIDLYELLS